MKKIISAALSVCVLGFLVLIGWQVKAQTANTVPWQIAVVGPHTQCSVVAAQTNFCFAADGIWQSLNGAAYVLIGAVGPAGPTGLTGLTGAAGAQGPAGVAGSIGLTGATGPQGPIGPQGPVGPSSVTSVNGKTGVVVLSLQ